MSPTPNVHHRILTFPLRPIQLIPRNVSHERCHSNYQPLDDMLNIELITLKHTTQNTLRHCRYCAHRTRTHAHACSQHTRTNVVWQWPDRLPARSAPNPGAHEMFTAAAASCCRCASSPRSSPTSAWRATRASTTARTPRTGTRDPGRSAPSTDTVTHSPPTTVGGTMSPFATTAQRLYRLGSPSHSDTTPTPKKRRRCWTEIPSTAATTSVAGA